MSLPDASSLDSNPTVGRPREPGQFATVELSEQEHPKDALRGSRSPLRAAVPSIPGYRIMAEIAKGGMGRVYAAFDETLEREVAIKTLLPGADAERFVNEGKITARLPHPGIPPVYALGTLPDGTPWLAMKLIRGQTLASLLPRCDRGTTDELSRDRDDADNPSRDRKGADNRRADALPSPSDQDASEQRELPGLSLPQLIQIFEQIAQAVGFAHSRGIIHRDLKPHNVMVGEFGEVQVMDWGLAKDISHRDVDEPSRDREGAEVPSPLHPSPTGRGSGEEGGDHTTAGTILGTPGYMAPEQARGEVVDQRADVFALGSILAKMLTGEPAFVGGSVLETVEKSASADLTEVMARLDRCSADQELIALSKRCLQADREDRPADACEVAAEVAAYRASVEQRLRQAETDRAKAETRAVEQAKRRRIVQWASAAIATALLTGLGVSLWQMNRAVTAERQTAEERDAKAKALEAEILAKREAEIRRQEAEVARQESQKRLAQIEKSNEIITSIFTDLDMRRIKQGYEPLEAVLAQRLVKAAGQLEGEAVGDPLMVAQLQDRLGQSLLSLGHAPAAVELFAKAHTTRASRLGPDHPDTLTSMNNLALGYQAIGKMDLALPLLEETLKLTSAKFGPDHPDTLTSMNNLARGYWATAKLELALPLWEQTLKLMKAHLGDDHPHTLSIMANLAAGYHATGRLDLALPLYQETLELMKAEWGPDHPDTLTTLGNLATAYQAVGKPDLALLLLEETLKLTRAKLGTDHPHTLIRMNNLAESYQAAGKLDQALPLLEQAALGVEKRQFQDEHAERIVRNFIRALEAGHDLPKAEVWQRKWLAVVKERLGGESEAFANELATLGLNLLRQRKYTEAEPLLRECLTIREKTQPDDWNTFNTVFLLGEALLGQKNYADAEPLLVKGYEGMKARQTTIPEDMRHTRLADALGRLIDLYTSVNKPDEVKKYRELQSSFPTPTEVPE